MALRVVKMIKRLNKAELKELDAKMACYLKFILSKHIKFNKLERLLGSLRWRLSKLLDKLKPFFNKDELITLEERYRQYTREPSRDSYGKYTPQFKNYLAGIKKHQEEYNKFWDE
jgi:hypothetical protein